jgi:cyclophilin family peptidyl-prolyl cis-trans isomerase
MARSNDPDSAGSQFYITREPAHFLDGQYTVFGKVTKGMDVVDRIERGDRISSIKIVDR